MGKIVLTDGPDGTLLEPVMGTRSRDRIFAHAGNDYVDGSSGNDTIFGGAGADRLEGGDGDDELHGGGGADSLIGGSGNLLAYGGSGDDSLLGSFGHSTLFGGSGADDIDAGIRSSYLSGGTGDDTLNSSSGDDTMVGGAGADSFRFGIMTGDLGDAGDGQNVVMDYVAGQDNLIFTNDFYVVIMGNLNIFTITLSVDDFDGNGDGVVDAADDHVKSKRVVGDDGTVARSLVIEYGQSFGVTHSNVALYAVAEIDLTP